MKKYISLVLFAVSAIMVSCGGSTSANNGEVDSLGIDTVAVLEEPSIQKTTKKIIARLQNGDVDGVKALMEQTGEELREVVGLEDTAMLRACAEEIQTFIAENARRLSDMKVDTVALLNFINTVKGVPAVAGQAIDIATETVKFDMDSLKESATSTVEKVTTDAAAKVNEKVENAVGKTAGALETIIKEVAAKANQK